MLRETNHDYHKGLVGCYHNALNSEGVYDSWEDFKENYLGFVSDDVAKFDDTYHFVFRFDIEKQQDGLYTIAVYVLLQRKGLLTHVTVKNISQEMLDTEVHTWLKGRKDYLNNLWQEIADN